MSVPRRILGLCGSLRAASANRAALQAARVLGAPRLEIELYEELAGLPPFDPDVEAAGLPPPVAALREAVGRASALLVACPEYAHGIPGAFKNLLDWLVGGLEFPGKPVLLLNCSGRGAHHAQDALAEVLRTMSARLVAPEPVPVRLPGAGAAVAQVLADPERCAELQVALACLASLPEAS